MYRKYECKYFKKTMWLQLNSLFGCSKGQLFELLFFISFFYFLQVKESIGFVKILDFRFLMDIRVLVCLEHDLTISGKCLCVCDKNFVASVAQELIHRISWNFVFSVILT